MIDFLSDAAGLVGAGLILGAYALVQFERLAADHPANLAMNFAGASLVFASLLVDFNAAAALLEAAWALISLYGLVRALARRARARTAGEGG